MMEDILVYPRTTGRGCKFSTLKRLTHVSPSRYSVQNLPEHQRERAGTECQTRHTFLTTTVRWQHHAQVAFSDKSLGCRRDSMSELPGRRAMRRLCFPSSAIATIPTAQLLLENARVPATDMVLRGWAVCLRAAAQRRGASTKIKFRRPSPGFCGLRRMWHVLQVNFKPGVFLHSIVYP